MQILIKIHHPHYLKTYDFHQVDNDHLYFDEKQTAITINAFSDRCVLPVNVLLLKKLRTSHLQLILAVTGTAIELLKKYRPDALESLRMLVKQPKVSILVTSFYNSCSDQFSVCEHNDQKELQAQLVRQVFGKDPLSLYCKQSTCVFDYETFTRSSRIELLDQIVESKISHHSSKVNFHFKRRKYGSLIIRCYYKNYLVWKKWLRLRAMTK